MCIGVRCVSVCVCLSFCVFLCVYALSFSLCRNMLMVRGSEKNIIPNIALRAPVD